MAVSLEDRVRVLEDFRYKMLGRINAYQTMTIGAWSHIAFLSDDPVALAKEVVAAWARGSTQIPEFPGVDPVHLDAVSQEYQEAITHLGGLLLVHVQAEADRLGLPRKT